MLAGATIFGNRCFHQRRNPRLRLHRRHSHPLIQQTIDELDRLYTSSIFEEALGPARSERREACILVLKALVSHVELRTLRVGITYSPGPDETFSGTGHERIVDLINDGQPETGVRRLSRWSLDRAIAALNETPILETKKQPREEYKPGQWAASYAIRVLSPWLWNFLGLSAELKAARKVASDAYKKQKKEAEAARVPTGEPLKIFTGKIARPLTSSPFENLTESQARLMWSAVYRLRQEHPEWDAETLRAAALAAALAHQH